MPDNPMRVSGAAGTVDHTWSKTIMARVNEPEAAAVIDAINQLAATRTVRLASIMAACAQILAQSIVGAPRDVAPEVRAGIMDMIDGYAMRCATEERG